MLSFFSLPFSCERSTTVDKPKGEVAKFVSDFSTWKSWSPWIIQEPSCPVNTKGIPGEVGHGQSWDGKYIGSGNMEIACVSDDRLDYGIHFVRPWKSSSKTAFTLKKVAEGKTEVTWFMHGTVPIFLFFIRRKMSAYVGADYERGLAMLKELMEDGVVSSKVEVLGPSEDEGKGFSFVGIRSQCSFDEVGPRMAEDFKRLKDLAAGEGSILAQPDFSFSFYHEWDIFSRTCDYTSCYGYRGEEKQTAELPADLESGSVPGHHAFRVVHTGSYKHLGNAWSTAFSRMEHNKLSQSGFIPRYEIYENKPSEVEDKDLRTIIYVPLK